MANESEDQTVEVDLSTVDETVIEKYLESKGKLVTTKTAKEKEISDAVAKTHTSWEDNLAEASGKKKPDGVRGIDWGKTLFKKEEDDTPKPPKPKDKDKDDDVEDPRDAKIRALAEEMTALKSQKDTSTKEFEEKAVNGSLKSTIRSLTFDGDASEQKESRENLEALLKNKYTIKLNDENELVAYVKNAEGKLEIVNDPETTEPMEIKKLISKKFGKLLAAEKTTEEPKTGSGTKPSDLVKKTTDGKKYIISKTVEGIREAALAQGWFPGSEEFNEFMLNSKKESKLDS